MSKHFFFAIVFVLLLASPVAAQDTTPTPSATATATPTATPSSAPTSTPTATPSSTATPTATATPTVKPSATVTPRATATPIRTSQPSATSTPSPTPTDIPTPTPISTFLPIELGSGGSGGQSSATGGETMVGNVVGALTHMLVLGLVLVIGITGYILSGKRIALIERVIGRFRKEPVDTVAPVRVQRTPNDLVRRNSSKQ